MKQSSPERVWTESSNRNGAKEVTSTSPLKEFLGSWLLPIFRENISNKELSFFIDYFLPLADVCHARIQRCKEEQDRIGFRVLYLLQHQMWALLPGFKKKTSMDRLGLNIYIYIIFQLNQVSLECYPWQQRVYDGPQHK